MLKNTVLVRHLPSSLTHQEKSELLRHFGAVDVRIVGPETKKSNLVYARFESNKAAEVGIRKLHQINVLGHRISAELARGPSTAGEEPVEPRMTNIHDEKEDRILRAKEAFLKKLGFSIKNYDFSQPPPLHIYYQYPPPTRVVLENICKAMANVPKLYTQVLHLMNKMNLPCPFTETYPLESDLFVESQTKLPVTDSKRVEEEQANEEVLSMSDLESEMGSDSEQQTGEIIPLKRKKAQKKVFKRPKFVKPQVVLPVQSVKVGLKPGDVFDNTQRELVAKKIELKITSDLSSIQVAQEIQAAEPTKEGFEVIKAPQKPQERSVETEDKEENNADDTSSQFITAEQLAANRISVKDQKVLPVFKNYQAGAPSCRLYVKNLAKQVQSRDLHFIYRRYYKSELDQEQGTMFDVRLMQEGRMKGQAFITLQSVAQAQTALRETNGFILKDKPMVVQFARSATLR